MLLTRRTNRASGLPIFVRRRHPPESVVGAYQFVKHAGILLLQHDRQQTPRAPGQQESVEDERGADGPEGASNDDADRSKRSKADGRPV